MIFLTSSCRSLPLCRDRGRVSLANLGGHQAALQTRSVLFKGRLEVPYVALDFNSPHQGVDRALSFSAWLHEKTLPTFLLSVVTSSFGISTLAFSSLLSASAPSLPSHFLRSFVRRSRAPLRRFAIRLGEFAIISCSPKNQCVEFQCSSPDGH